MYMCVVECVSRYLVHSLHSQEWAPTLAHLPPATLLHKLDTPHTKLDTPHTKLAIPHTKLGILLLLPGTHHLLPGTHHLLPEVTHTLLEDKYASLLQP